MIMILSRPARRAALGNRNGRTSEICESASIVPNSLVRHVAAAAAPCVLAALPLWRGGAHVARQSDWGPD